MARKTSLPLSCRFVAPERVGLLRAMACAIAPELTRIEDKAVHRKRTASEQAVFHQVLADLRGRGVLQASQGEMRRIFPIFQFNAHPEQEGDDLALERHQGLATLNPGPDNPGLSPGRKKSHPSHAQVKRDGDDPSQGLANVEEGGPIDFADEAEGDVQLIGRQPAGSGQAAAEQGQLLPDLLWGIDGDEKSFIHA